MNVGRTSSGKSKGKAWGSQESLKHSSSNGNKTVTSSHESPARQDQQSSIPNKGSRNLTKDQGPSNLKNIKEGTTVKNASSVNGQNGLKSPKSARGHTDYLAFFDSAQVTQPKILKPSAAQKNAVLQTGTLEKNNTELTSVTPMSQGTGGDFLSHSQKPKTLKLGGVKNSTPRNMTQSKADKKLENIHDTTGNEASQTHKKYV